MIDFNSESNERCHSYINSENNEIFFISTTVD